MYRVLLKSMNLVCSDDKDQNPRRSCREGPEPGETEQEPDLHATYLIGLSSTIDPGAIGPTYTKADRHENPPVLPAA
jgi:hypothetical protein